MAKFTLAMSSVLMASVIAGLAGCGEKEKAAPVAPPAPPITVGGTVSGLAGGEVVLQLNDADDLTVKNNGKFKFSKVLKKGATYAVAVKTSPTVPVKQTCKVSLGNGNITGAAINNVDVACTTNSYAVGGTVSGLTAKSKGVVLELKGGNSVTVTKNGTFIFPDTRLPDGGDYSVVLDSTPPGQQCKIEAIATAVDKDTLNIVSVTCSKKGSRK